MTKAEFFAELATVNLEWRLTSRDEIRACYTCACPLTAVAASHGKYLPLAAWFEAAKFLGLDEHDATDILVAADSRVADAPDRDNLLIACGLPVAERSNQ